MQRTWTPHRFPAFVAAASAAVVTVALAGALNVGFGPLPGESIEATEVAISPARIEVFGVRDATRAETAFDTIVPAAAGPLLRTSTTAVTPMHTSAVASARCNS